MALADQVEGAVVQWKPDEEPYSHLSIEVEICELKRYRDFEYISRHDFKIVYSDKFSH